MRFQNTFEVTLDARHRANMAPYIENGKLKGSWQLGEKIAELFDYKETQAEYRCLFDLIIQAFPQNKWLEFKESLLELLETPPGDEHAKRAFELINKLESFGEPLKTQQA